jgi:hypothetical protein
MQLLRVAGIGVAPTTGNTAWGTANLMTSYGSNTDPNGTWNDGLSWKGATMAFRNNRLLAYFYRQANSGNAFSDSSLVMSPDAGSTWIDYGRYNAYTVTGASCTGTTATFTATNALSAGQLIYVHDVGSVYNGKQTVAMASTSQVAFTVSTCTGGYWFHWLLRSSRHRWERSRGATRQLQHDVARIIGEANDLPDHPAIRPGW